MRLELRFIMGRGKRKIAGGNILRLDRRHLCLGTPVVQDQKKEFTTVG